MRLPVRSASCYNWRNPEEAREKLEGEFSRALTEVAPISFNRGVWLPPRNTTRRVRQPQIDAADNGNSGYWSSVGGTNGLPNRPRHMKPTVGAMEQGKWSAAGVMTPRKQATQIGKRENKCFLVSQMFHSLYYCATTSDDLIQNNSKAIDIAICHEIADSRKWRMRLSSGGSVNGGYINTTRNSASSTLNWSEKATAPS
ncbi:hypothetical protein DY000_02026760 [Brassica cretica]|uniref:Uncharacterized protein n=1 Tax=Brassica cretica TaxID=69181 RepID=A0ABQ7E1W7_BRACR|nr:hypothetical protein DY000_02026760 [Brassica cretica]